MLAKKNLFYQITIEIDYHLKLNRIFLLKKDNGLCISKVDNN